MSSDASEPNGESPRRSRLVERKLKRLERRLIIALIALIVPLAISFGILLAGGTKSDSLDSPNAIAAAVNALLLTPQAIHATAYVARMPEVDGLQRRSLAIMVINSFLLITVNFAVLCRIIGTPVNFNVGLSPIGALYFALGTLTTAGTGDVYPRSSLARAIVSWQMVLGFAFVAGALTLALARWGEKSR